MALNGVNGKRFSEQMNAGFQMDPKLQRRAKEEFAANLLGKAERKTEEDSEDNQDIEDKKSINRIENYYGKVATELMISWNGSVQMDAVIECGVRYMKQSESDYVKSFVSEGFTLKAKIEMDAHRVYIEQKWEDGTYQAYEVNPFEVSKDTEDPIEKTAAEAWRKAEKLFNEGMAAAYDPDRRDDGENEDVEIDAFAKMVEDFHVYVKKRLKEGPPKIQIGGSEFSEEEWDKLMRRIDREIDAYKEELRERIRKDQGEEPVSPPSGSAVEMKSLAETAGADPGGEESKDTPVPEKEALKAGGSMPQKGSGFLSRIMGEKKAPYSFLADESGMIVYNGVTFVCDDKKQQICLGDMTDTKNVLTIPLSKGGSLKVNRDNLGDLARAIGMFSSEDVERILRAIARDNKVRQMELELEEMRHKGV